MPLIELLKTNTTILSIACFGGLVLFGFTMAEHFNRAPENKLSVGRYVIFFIFLLFTLPALGGGMVVVYLANGDKISPLLSLQIGLTSPAIVQGLLKTTANTMAKKTVVKKKPSQN